MSPATWSELNRVYPEGLLRVHGSYSEFLEKKEEFLHAQAKRQEALENLVHTEIEWLRRGAKARTTKIQGPHRQGWRADQRTRRLECPNPHRQRAN